MIHALLLALAYAGSMTWQILWSLILGFLLSACIQALVQKTTIAKLLGDERPRTLVRASLLGIASSSCSYAAVAISRTLFQKGASFTAAMVFEIASTNLVVELGIIMALLLGWQFTLAEFVGGPLMIVLLAVLFRLFLRKSLLAKAHEQSDKGLAGSMEGHAAMDMSVSHTGTFWHRLLSNESKTSVSHIFIMELAAIWKDLIGGLLIAGAIAAWVPPSFFRGLFASTHPVLSHIWSPLVGPLIAVVTFVCSIGNVPLAAVLWHDGMSFGGVISFIFADLIIIPILLIYRRYYGTAMTIVMSLCLYAVMVIAGWAVDGLFHVFHLIPASRATQAFSLGIHLNYTSILNLLFLLVAVWLTLRFFRTGGLAMLRMMDDVHPETMPHDS